MAIVPRDYQAEATEASVEYLLSRKMKGRNGVVVAPTGSGKSVVIAGIAMRLNEPVLVFQPSKEILIQNLGKLASYGYPAAVFSASLDRREIGPITLATIGSVVANPEAFRRFKYVLIDECHAAVNPKGGQFDDFLAAIPQARVLGLTATPFRLASNSMGSELRFLTRTVPRIFNDVVHQTPIRTLYEQGYLTPLDYRVDEVIRREKLKPNAKGSDYTDASVQAEMFEVGFVGKLQAEVERAFAEGRKNVLTFTRFVDESRRLAAVVSGSGLVSADDDRNRDEVLRAFRRGELRHVTNVGIVSIGFDFPALECVVLGRSTVSLAVYYQQVGRIVRPVYAGGYDLSTVDGRLAAIAAGPKPKAYVVDLVGSVKQFGRVEDLELRPSGKHGREWAIYSGSQQLTNRYFFGGDGFDPAVAAKARKRRQFWAKRRATT